MNSSTLMYRFSLADRLARWWLIRRGLLIDLQPRNRRVVPTFVNEHRGSASDLHGRNRA